MTKDEAKDAPVAWRTFDGEGGYDYRTYENNEDYANDWDKRNPKHKGWVEPLYTTPPQRTWVGLTEEDKQDWIKCMPWPPEPAHLMVLIEGIELELRELNS